MLENSRIFLRFHLIFLYIFVSFLQLSLQAQERTSFETTALNLNYSQYEEDYKAFQTESDLENSQIQAKSRAKRYIYLNVQSNLDVGFLCVIPITIIIPSMSNLFNKWRRKRSLQQLDADLTEDAIEDHPLVQPHLDKISTYFELLDIPEHHCQLRAICEFSSDPSTYYPISEVILSRLRVPLIYSSIIYDDKTQSNSNSTGGSSLYDKYSDAADDGVSLGHPGCQERYGKGCKYSMQQLLSMNSLRIWKGLQSQLGVGVKEDFEL